MNDGTDCNSDVEKSMPLKLTLLVPIVYETKVQGMTMVRKCAKGVLLDCKTGMVLPGIHEVVRKEESQKPSSLCGNDCPGPEWYRTWVQSGNARVSGWDSL